MTKKSLFLGLIADLALGAVLTTTSTQEMLLIPQIQNLKLETTKEMLFL